MNLILIIFKKLSRMKTIFIRNTFNTPAVFFNVKKGILRFSGKSLPENAIDFYKQIEDGLNEFFLNYSDVKLEITCEFEYINTSSSKILFNLLKKAIDHQKNNIIIIWCYEEDDFNMLKQGEIFANALDFEFYYRIFAD